MNGDVEELYDYAALRTLDVVTMFAPRINRPILVLGSSQSVDVLNSAIPPDTALRRRRGGGGLVLLRPGDVWVDWWIPALDDQWSRDVRMGSLRAGDVWRDVVAARTNEPVTIHKGALEGDVAHRVVCFAGRGPGEVFLGGRKAVGVTQWRVREGMFLSTVLPSHNSREVLNYLRDVPAGLEEALGAEDFSQIAATGIDDVLDELRVASGAEVVARPLLGD